MSPEVPIIILILAIPVYFLTKLILKKLKFGNERNRKYLSIIPTVILSPILFVGIIMIWIFTVSYYPTSEFNKNEWKTNVEERYKLSENIIESKMLIGKTRDEVIELLGNDFISNSETKLTYELGFVPGLFNIDPDYLDIEFKNGIVISVSQNQ